MHIAVVSFRKTLNAINITQRQCSSVDKSASWQFQSFRHSVWFLNWAIGNVLLCPWEKHFTSIIPLRAKQSTRRSGLVRIKMLFFLFSSQAFPRRLRGKQLQINSPHLPIHQHRLHFAWIKSQTVPTKILDTIKPSCSRSSN